MLTWATRGKCFTSLHVLSDVRTSWIPYRLNCLSIAEGAVSLNGRQVSRLHCVRRRRCLPLPRRADANAEVGGWMSWRVVLKTEIPMSFDPSKLAVVVSRRSSRKPL